MRNAPMNPDNTTVEFYNRNAAQFVETTRNVAMKPLYKSFLQCLQPGAKILDAGCGSGRDTAAFLKRGYQVSAFDASEKMCELASQYTGIHVQKLRLEDFHHQECYNGIWACASLLHLPVESQHKVVDEFLKALSPNGVLYASWKYGSETYSQDGRFFCDMTPVTLREFFEKHPDINILKLWETPDFQKRKNWVNILVQKTV